MNHKPRFAEPFIALIALAGLASLAYGWWHATTWHPYEALALFAITVAASRMKVKLPGLAGNMSVNLPFLLLAAADLNQVEAIAIAVVSTAVQCFPKDGTKPKLVRVLFNLSLMSSAVALAAQVFHMGAVAQPIWFTGALVLPAAGLTSFLMQTMPVATVIALTEGGPVTAIWTKIARMTFPYYVLSAGMASMMMAARQHVGWQVPLLALPVMYGMYRSYQTYFGRDAADPISHGMSKAAAAGH
ncbi:MAG TPA: hypothetical protein VNY29_20715 [Terriglobales bacterium]|nr:hypothetical protein [Terriglobales bacterium]